VDEIKDNELDDGVILAKDIESCTDCPIFKNGCPGGMTAHREPPCCSWDADTEVNANMYIKD